MVGWVKTKGIAALRFAINKDDGIRDVAVETYPIHDKLDYDNPSATTGWFTKCKSKWERKEHVYVPVYAEIKSQNGIPGEMDCVESTASIEWKFLKKDDEWGFRSDNLDSQDRSLADFFRK